jgi:hypothetical protein
VVVRRLGYGAGGQMWAVRAAAATRGCTLVRQSRLMRDGTKTHCPRVCCATTAGCCMPSGSPAAVVVDLIDSTMKTRCYSYYSPLTVGCVLLVARSFGVRQFRRKSCLTCVGASGDGAIGRRFPPWRHCCEAQTHPPTLGVLSPGGNLIWCDELAMATSSMSLLLLKASLWRKDVVTGVYHVLWHEPPGSFGHPRRCFQDGIFQRMVKSCIFHLLISRRQQAKGTLARVVLVCCSLVADVGHEVTLGLLLGLACTCRCGCSKCGG